MNFAAAHLNGKEVQVRLQLAVDMMVVVVSFKDKGKVPHLCRTFVFALPR